jgi:hypothetical protein
MVELVLQPCILDEHVLFLKGLLPKHGRAPTAAARRALHCLPNRDVLGPIAYRSPGGVLMPL